MNDEIRRPEPEMACWPNPEFVQKWRAEQRRRHRGFFLIGCAVGGFVAFVAWIVWL